MMPFPFGIEEEMMLLDVESLRPQAHADAAIGEFRGDPALDKVAAEFLPCQVEHATGVHTSAASALDDLQRFRTAIAHWCASRSLVPAFTGTPPRLPRRAQVIRGDRYRRIARDVGALAQEHYVNGTHIHVGIDDIEVRVRVSNGLREWLPILVAASGNSPFWAGADTGHLSWRAVQTRRWTTNGVPPVFADHAEQERICERMLGVGATQLAREFSWGVRLSTQYPTVEVRVCDSQLDASDAVALAELVVAISDHVLRSAPRPSPHHVLDAEMWHAARFGLAHGVHDPLHGAHRPASAVVADIRRALALGAHAERLLARALTGDQGGARQRRAQSDDRLRELYASCASDARG